MSQFPLPMARPGGMRGAIRRPCRRQALACQTQSKNHNLRLHLQSHLCRSLTSSKVSPSTHAHSARPTQIDHPPGFYNFQKTVASAERGAKKLCAQHLGKNLHQKCKLQDASFMFLMLQPTFYITFFQNCCSCIGGEDNFAKRFHALLIEKSTILTPKRLR